MDREQTTAIGNRSAKHEDLQLLLQLNVGILSNQNGDSGLESPGKV